MSTKTLENIAVFLISTIAVVHAFLNRFVCDDALISFTYAKNYAAGHGLVFHPDLPPVEGYTNFLWTLSLGILGRVFDIESSAHALSLSSFFISCILLHRLATRYKPGAQAIVALIVFAFSSTTVLFATSGLETSLQVLLTISMFTLLPCRGVLPSTLMGLVFAAAILLRLDAGLICAVVTVSLLVEGRTIKEMAPTLIIPAICIVVLFAWRLHTYDDWLPNTFYVKIGGNWVKGLIFVVLFASTYLIPITFISINRRVFKEHHATYLVFALIWTLYIINAGGGFMEFRLLAPTVPLIALAAGHVYEEDKLKGTILAGSLVLFGIIAQHVPVKVMDIWSRTSMMTFAENQRKVGAALTVIDPSGSALVAEGAVGGVAYVSNSPIIDVFGLNDRQIAKTHHVRHNNVPGHQLVATVSHLRERGVHISNLRIHHSRTVLVNVLHSRKEQHWPEAKVVLLKDSDAGFLYTKTHPTIESGIQSGRLIVAEQP